MWARTDARPQDVLNMAGHGQVSSEQIPFNQTNYVHGKIGKDWLWAVCVSGLLNVFTATFPPKQSLELNWSGRLDRFTFFLESEE